MMLLYDKHKFNCAHYAIGELNRIYGLGVVIENGDEWQMSFWRQLSHKFRKSVKPFNNCLTVMINRDDSLHVGIYRDGGVWHNWRAGDGSSGQVIKSDLTTLRQHHKEIKFYVCKNPAVSS